MLIGTLLLQSAAIAGPCKVVKYQVYTTGDIELEPDPANPADLLMALNQGVDPVAGTNILVCPVDGTTGLVGTCDTVAANYTGLSLLNGPEFVEDPVRGLGLLYACDTGVCGVWRGPSGAFDTDVDGNPIVGQPVGLAGSMPGDHPMVQLRGATYYGAFDGTCQGRCFGTFEGASLTDLPGALVGYTMNHGVLDPVVQGGVIFGGCNGPTDCGIFRVIVDGQGGVVGSPQRMTAYMGPVDVRNVIAQLHPVNGDLVVIATIDDTLAVQRAPDGSNLQEVVTFSGVPVEAQHLRLVSNDVNGQPDPKLFLHLFVRNVGSWVWEYTDQGPFVPPTKVSHLSSGTELIWLPGAQRLAIVYLNEYSNRLLMCDVTL